jgi:hypothetical protein
MFGCMKNSQHAINEALWSADARQVRREADLARFAHGHGWRLRYYHDGFCAFFDKEPRRRS